MTSTSLLVGLFVNGIGLLGYNAETYDLDENEISHFAKTHYLSPFVTLILGLVIASGIWVILQLFSIVLSDDNYGALTIVAILIGAISLRVSAKIEKIIFEKKV
jgi:hypothetical protein